MGGLGEVFCVTHIRLELVSQTVYYYYYYYFY